MVKMLLDNGADVDAQGDELYSALSALHMASDRGHMKVVEVLLDRGAELKNEDLYNSLKSALYGGHDKISQVLLDQVVNNDGLDKALRTAVLSGDDRMLRLLRDHDPAFGRSIGH